MRLQLLLLLLVSQALHASPIRRFALFVGRNDGGADKPRLKYATADAMSVAKVFSELGGVADLDRDVLLNPNRTSLQNRLDRLSGLIREEHRRSGRTQFLFYFSGHSDGEGLLLGDEVVPYRELRQAIRGLASDVNIVVVDSCASGNLTRLKGGRTVAPFLTDSVNRLKGYVALTSSSNDEAAQESDRLKGSFFTHHFVSGLRGAADFHSQNQVTLQDAYQYAYQQTLAQTENTVSGPQHPSYSIELSGSGELVMTDLRKTSAKLLLDRALIGRILVRDADDRIVAEVDKTAPNAMVLGLEPGNYSVLIFRDRRIAKASVVLEDAKAVPVSALDFVPLAAEATVAKGIRAIEPLPWDLSLQSGITGGRMSFTNSDLSGDVDSVVGDFNGLLLKVALNHDFSRRFSVTGGVGAVMDMNHGNFFRLGLEVGTAFHVFGGSWQGPQPHSYNVSLVLRMAVNHYNYYTTAGGAVAEFPFGIQGRMSLGDRSALQLDFTRVAAMKALSSPAFDTSVYDLGLSYRFLF